MLRDDVGTISEDEILQIIQLVSESNLYEVSLELPGLKLIIRKGAGTAGNYEPSLSQERLSQSIEGKTPDVVVSTSEVQFENHDVASLSGEKDLVEVRAPSLGIFYRAPKPGVPPFVEVGKHVKEGDTLCLLEIMKLYTNVQSGLFGRIVKICAEDAEMVEYDQVLFLIEPDTGLDER